MIRKHRVTLAASLILAATLVTSLLPLRAASAAEEEVVAEPTLSQPAGNCGVDEGGDRVTFGGTATPGARIVGAALREYAEDGSYLDADHKRTLRNTTLSADGVIAGSMTLPYLDAFEPEQYTAGIALSVTVEKDGIQSTGVSNIVKVDRDFPHIIGIETVSSQSVRVRFDEGVRAPEGELGLDWEIDGSPAALVTPTAPEDPSARMLHVLPTKELPEDATPLVRYLLLPERAPYEDCVGHTVRAEGREQIAVDKILPRVPEITSIAGRTVGGDVTHGNDDTPSLVATRVTDNHVVSLHLETNGQQGLQESDQELGTAVAVEGRATFDVAGAPLPQDGDYTFYARTTDIHGNKSDGADSALYRLDRIIPEPKSARTNGETVTVSLTEAVVGRNNAADWTVTDKTGTTYGVTGVSGEGDTRVLEAAGVPHGADVSYTNPGTDGYEDVAGNTLDNFGELATEGLLPKVVTLAPDAAVRPVAKAQELTVAVADDAGAAVPGTIIGIRAIQGPSASKNVDGDDATAPGVIGTCVAQANGSCALSYTSTSVGSDVLQAWIDSDRNVRTIDARRSTQTRIDWTTEGADLRVDASPETSTALLVDSKTIDVSLTTLPTLENPTAEPVAISGANLDMRWVSGQSSLWLGECSTAADGTCSITYRATNAATDELQIWIDRNGDDAVRGDELLFDDYFEHVGADGLVAIDDPTQDSVSIVWERAARTLSLGVSKSKVTFGRSVKLSGRLRGHSACTTRPYIRVFRSPTSDGTFRQIKQVRATVTDRWSVTLKPRYNGFYMGRVAQSRTCAGFSTAVKAIRVRASVPVAASDRTVDLYECTRLSGSVRPSKARKIVELLYFVGGRWKSLADDKLDGRSRYSFRRCFSGTGYKKFKVVYRADGRNAFGSSRIVTIRVTR